MKNLSLGTVVAIGDERPVYHDKRNSLIAGDTASYVDVLMVNMLGEKKLVRFPLSHEAREFYARVPPLKPTRKPSKNLRAR